MALISEDIKNINIGYDIVETVCIGATQVRPTSSFEFKSYQEIVAMSVDDAVTELNKNPNGYLHKFLGENHILRGTGGWYYLSSNGDMSGVATRGSYYVRAARIGGGIYTDNWDKTTTKPAP